MQAESIQEILGRNEFSRDDLLVLLGSDVEARNLLFRRAGEVKEQAVGNKVYLRGLIEFSNRCSKNCLYCGIRAGNRRVKRYELKEDEVLQAARFAMDHHYGSVVLQSGERSGKFFTAKVSSLLKKIHTLSQGKLGITLSMGEQCRETYRQWFEDGAHRYLLRIESSNRDLYYSIHPRTSAHDYDRRLECLHLLQQLGYQVGTGVMIGLPFQTHSHLADDLQFIKNFDADMVGMGPYIEHRDTPLYTTRDRLWSLEERFTMTLKMIAILRLMMPRINMAATTALQAIDPIGREKAIRVGANIMMPNITPAAYRGEYVLYDNKPCTDEGAEDCTNCMDLRVHLAGNEIGWDEWGDSRHFSDRRDALQNRRV